MYIDDEWVKEFDIEKLAKEIVSGKRESVYIDYPFKREAFIYSIITYETFYDVYNSWVAQNTRRLKMETNDQQWYEANSNCEKSLRNLNIHCPSINVIVGFNRVKGVKWNQSTNTYTKEYKNDVEYLPLQMVTLERNDSHYLNLEPRIHNPLLRFESLKKAMLCDQKYFGLTTIIKQPTTGGEVNPVFRYYDLTVNEKKEERKVRDLFFAKNIIAELMKHETKYSSIDHISKRLNMSYQVINRITSSIFVKYTEGGEKKTVDIGLKLRNNNQKLHIPIDVIYTETQSKYYPEPKQFWGFSDKAEYVIGEYLYTFPWLKFYVDARAHHEAGMRSNSRYHKNEDRFNKLEDAMPFFETEEERMKELQKLTDWLDNCELSNRSFVPAGFRFLSNEARKQIEETLKKKKAIKQEKIPSEFVKVDPRTIFTEMFPFWTSPFITTIKDFAFGDRVANIDTSKRKYIPFGDIGTVVGHTLDSVIIRFDEPNVSLTDVHNTCPAYTGAVVTPNSLINLTQQAELSMQGKQKNYREAPHKKEGGYQKNYRKYYGKKENYGKFNKAQGSSYKEEEKQEKKGYTKYYNSKLQRKEKEP